MFTALSHRIYAKNPILFVVGYLQICHHESSLNSTINPPEEICVPQPICDRHTKLHKEKRIRFQSPVLPGHLDKFHKELVGCCLSKCARLLWNYQPQCPLAGASRIFKGWSHLSRQTEREILKGVGEHDGPVNLIWLISNEVFAYGLFGDFHVCACVCACICVCVLASAIDTQWHLGCQSSVIKWLSHTHEYSVSVHAWP